MKNTLLFILAVFSINLSLPAQNRYFVKANAGGANNGFSWDDAFIDLHAALQIAQAGDEVWVAEGLYVPTSDTDRDRTFEPASGVKLYGGFAGTESNPVQRDWAAHPTVLSGDIGVHGDSTDNSYNVLFLFEPDSSTLLDGFVIRDGVANKPLAGAFDRGTCGGGLFIQSVDLDAFGVVRNCVFVHNAAQNYGGAVMINGFGGGSSAPRFIHCVFEGNRVLGSGGGLARFGASWEEVGTDFEDCRFVQNQAGLRGGGLYYSDSEGNDKIELKHCLFYQNRAVKAGGGAYLVTGRSNGSEWEITGTEFEENVSDDGGALRFFPSGFSEAKALIIESCLFVDNKFVDSPGSTFTTPCAVFIDQIGAINSNYLISRTELRNHKNWGSCLATSWNDAEGVLNEISVTENLDVGGLILIEPEKLIIQKSSFLNNLAVRVVVMSGYHHAQVANSLIAGNHTGDIFSEGGGNNLFPVDTIEIINTTIVGNQITMPDDLSDDKDYKFINNSVLSGIKDTRSFLYSKQGTVISNSYIDSINCAAIAPFHITCGSGNILGGDPLFRDTAHQDYSLLPCSPLINAGSNAAAAGLTDDLTGNPRNQGGKVDIGAYEASAFALAAEPLIHPACEGFSNGSISINPVFGCEPYTYQWSPGAGNGPELKDLSPGNYLLTLTDGSGRQILDTLSVAAAPSPVLDPQASDVQCGELSGGSIVANVSGGTAPYHFDWLPAATDTAQLAYLSPGAYSLTVVDAYGCQDSSREVIGLRGGLTPMISGRTISCFGAADGWLSLTPATGAAPFQWQWDGWPGTDSIAQPLGPGSYSATVTDIYGCTASNSFPPMTQPDSLWAAVHAEDQTDLVMPNGTAAVIAISGGTAPFDFEWSTGSTLQAIEALVAGNYRVTVTDKNGCEAVVEVVVDLMVNTTEMSEGQAFILYPNPSADWLKVVFSVRPGQAGPYKIEIADLSGKVLQVVAQTSAATGVTLDLRGLPVGPYVVTLRNMAGIRMFVGKVMKN